MVFLGAVAVRGYSKVANVLKRGYDAVTGFATTRNFLRQTARNEREIVSTKASPGESGPVTAAESVETSAGQGLAETSQIAKEGVAETVNRATSFAGSRRSPLDYAQYQQVRNTPANINGREYCGHALDRMQDRGLFPSVIENSIINGKTIVDKVPGRIQYYDSANKVRVIAEDSGKVITIIPGRG